MPDPDALKKRQSFFSKVFTKKPSEDEIKGYLSSAGITSPSKVMEPEKPSPKEVVSLRILQDQITTLEQENTRLRSSATDTQQENQTHAMEVASHEVTKLRDQLKQSETTIASLKQEIATMQSHHKKEVDRAKRNFAETELSLREEISQLRDEPMEETQPEEPRKFSTEAPTEPKYVTEETLDINDLLEDLENENS